VGTWGVAEEEQEEEALSCFGFYCPFTDCHLRILLILLQQQTQSIYVSATQRVKKTLPAWDALLLRNEMEKSIA
jgi:hypothetical protein